jgi:inhibitor of cysteine peptidase
VKRVMLCRSFAWGVILVLMACASQVGYATAIGDKELAMTEVTLGAADRGRLIEVAPGSRVLLRLPENPSTGYRWELEPLEGDALKRQADTYQPPATLAPGAGGVRVFDFLARSPGNVVLRLRLRRPWEPAGAAAETFEVTVQISPRSGSGP